MESRVPLRTARKNQAGHLDELWYLSRAMEPYLVFRKSGRTIALVLAFGFGGGTLLLGVGSAALGALSAAALLPALQGYLLASLPFFLAAAVLRSCRRELWVVPEQGVLRMLTFRPWYFRGPRVEQADLDEYSGLCTVSMDHASERATLAVALIAKGGDRVPVREFDERDAADTFARELSDASGLPRVVADIDAPAGAEQSA
jgi:hypothetical protein